MFELTAQTLEIMIPYIFWGVLIGITYNVYNYILKNEPGTWEIKRAISSVIFGIAVGVLAAIIIVTQDIDTTTLDWWTFVVGLSVSYYGGLAVVNKLVDAIWERIFGAKFGLGNFGSTVYFFPPSQALVAGIRKMSEESRHFLIFDLPEWAKGPTLLCVDQAESTTPVTYRYAIRSNGWIFLIEGGQLTGAKHYWFSWNTQVEWKPISGDTLETIRKSRKFPEYSQLT